ncbi:MAG: helix-turn-helix transcriptional regulator [Flavobacteriaceae bacterium]
MMEFIALKLKKVRLNRGISQEDLAYICGLNRNYIGIIEKGQTNISMKVFLKLCKGLNENPADILKEVDLAYLEKAEL